MLNDYGIKRGGMSLMLRVRNDCIFYCFSLGFIQTIILTIIVYQS